MSLSGNKLSTLFNGAKSLKLWSVMNESVIKVKIDAAMTVIRGGEKKENE